MCKEAGWVIDSLGVGGVIVLVLTYLSIARGNLKVCLLFESMSTKVDGSLNEGFEVLMGYDRRYIHVLFEGVTCT